MQFEVGSEVPEEDVYRIRRGFATVGLFLGEWFGGDIPVEVQCRKVAKVVATGRGNEEPGGGGACCTATSWNADPPWSMRPFFDVRHPHWGQVLWIWDNNASLEKEKVAAHEYVHGWQSTLGCGGLLGGWMDEGIAEFVAYGSKVQRGEISRDTAHAFMLSSAKQSGEWEPLRNYADHGPAWPGHVGYLAIERAVVGAPNGLLAIRDVCTLSAAGSTRESAFEGAFGVSLEQFYTDFEAWKTSQN